MGVEARLFMSRIWILLLAVSLAGPVRAEAPVVLVIGDSLSAAYGIDSDAGWVALLAERLQSAGHPHRVVNASIVGDTTQGGVERLPRALRVHQPEVVIIELGGNDGLRGFPPARIRDNLEQIIVRAKASGAAVVLLGIRIPSNYGARYSASFEAVYRDVSEKLGIEWIEFFMEGIALNDALLQEDRIHPNAEAQPLLLDNAWPIIERALRDGA